MNELQQLIHECAKDNRRAQEKLYLRFYPALFLLCKRFFTNDHEAMECLNDGMLKVYKKIGSFRADKGVFFNWIYTIVRNTALDRLKLRRALPATEITETVEFSLEGDLLDALEWKDVYVLLDVLAPATRIVCTLYYIEGFSIKEISAKLELSVNTVKWHLRETRIKLRSVFKQYYF